MANVLLESIYTVERTGLLLTDGGELKVPPDLIEGAVEVRRTKNLPAEFISPSATSAAAWLLCMSSHVYGQEVNGFQGLEEQDIGWKGIALSFRGQAERFKSFVPSSCRG